MSEIAFKHSTPLFLLTKGQSIIVPFKKRKLSEKIVARYYLAKWRRKRDFLIDEGVPPVSSVILPSVNNHAYFSWNGKNSTVIYVPVNGASLQVDSSSRSQKWNDQLVLLHEWGHAFLYPPSSPYWIKYLSKETLYHAHPAWAHVDNYVGWRVFNEMFADVWSTAWLLRLSKREVAVIDLLCSLKTHRKFYENNFDSLEFPCLHSTYDAITMASYELWDMSPNKMIEKIFHIANKAFEKWLNREKTPGNDICQVGLEHLKFLDDKWLINSSSLTVNGRTWKVPGRPQNIHSKNLLLDLMNTQPHHPLLSFKSSIECINS